MEGHITYHALFERWRPPKEVKDEHFSPIGSSLLGKRHVAVVAKHYRSFKIDQRCFLFVTVFEKREHSLVVQGTIKLAQFRVSTDSWRYG